MNFLSVASGQAGYHMLVSSFAHGDSIYKEQLMGYIRTLGFSMAVLCFGLFLMNFTIATRLATCQG